MTVVALRAQATAFASCLPPLAAGAGTRPPPPGDRVHLPLGGLR